MESELVLLGSFSEIEAYLSKQALAKDGIHAVLPDEYARLHGDSPAAMQLWVRAQDSQRARELLAQSSEGVEARLAKGELIPCPECGSQSTEVIWRPPTRYFAWLFYTLFRDMTRAKLRCNSCGNEWDTRWYGGHIPTAD